MKLLDEMVKATERAPCNEAKLSTIAKTAAVVGSFALAFKQWKLPAPSRFSFKSALDYAKALFQAETTEKEIVAAIGLLTIVSNVFMKHEELRHLGHALKRVLSSEALAPYLEGE